MDRLFRLKESFHLKTHGSKEKILNFMRVLSSFISILAISSIFYYHGFPKTEHSIFLTNLIINSALVSI